MDEFLFYFIQLFKEVIIFAQVVQAGDVSLYIMTTIEKGTRVIALSRFTHENLIKSNAFWRNVWKFTFLMGSVSR